MDDASTSAAYAAEAEHVAAAAAAAAAAGTPTGGGEHSDPHPHSDYEQQTQQQQQQQQQFHPQPHTGTHFEVQEHLTHQDQVPQDPDSYEPHHGGLPATTSAEPDHHSLHYDDLASPLSAASAAHQNVQLLQAATAATAAAAAASASPVSPSLIAQQYAQSASLHVNDALQPQHQHPHQHPHPHQHQHQHPHQHQHMAPVSHDAHPLPPSGTPQSEKVTRLRRACDMCSQRKVKCDESGPPCKPCADLNVDCTFQREMKRRGPPNKHAEAAKAVKRARMETNTASPGPQQHAAQALVSIAGQEMATHMDAEAIAPWPVLLLLVDDFFTYIHPLIPFPHEPTFRQKLSARHDKTDRSFLALLSSMIGTLVASFPRSVRSHLKTSHSPEIFPTAVTMVDRCRTVALQARGYEFQTKDEISVYDAATSYFLGLAAAYTFRLKTFKRCMAEAMIFCRELGIHRQPDTTVLMSSASNMSALMHSTSPKPIDHITDQIGKRIFWVVLVGLRSLTQLGSDIDEIPLPPPNNQQPYPDMPLEVDDQYIYADQILPQPEGTTSLITGFNRNISVYLSMNELMGVDMCYGMSFFEWKAQKTMLVNALHTAKVVTNDMPPELYLDLGAALAGPAASPAEEPGMQYCPPAYPDLQPSNDVRLLYAQHPDRRRKLQYEIQKANIYASQLATRSYFVERYLNLRDAHRSQAAGGGAADAGDEVDGTMTEERELIIRNLLLVLTSITQRNMEPNGASLVNKIRQVASTLLHDAPERKGPLALKADEYLGKFVDILMKLEKSNTVASTEPGTMTAQDEDEELRHWANLRDYQLQFAQNNLV